MKDRLLLFVKMLYDHKLVLKAYKAPLMLTLLLLFANIMLVGAPAFFGLLDGADRPEDLQDVHAAFVELYEDDVDCRIEEYEMVCAEDYDKTYGAYRFLYVESVPDAGEIETSTIYFTPGGSTVVQVEEDNDLKTLTAVGGNYLLIGNLDFTRVESQAEERDDKESFYNSFTDNYLQNLYFADTMQSVVTLYSAQFFQVILYAMFVAAMYLLLNYRAPEKRITFASAFKLTVFAMTGPALLSAMLGYFIYGWANLLFIILYLIRVVVVYYHAYTTEKALL